MTVENLSTEKNTPVRLAVLGVGYGTYVLVPAFRRIAGVEIVALCSASQNTCVPSATRLGIPRTAVSLAELNDVALDAIAIAVPPRAQPHIIDQAIDRNLAIFGEKPLAADLASAEQIFDRVTRADIITAVDFIFPETSAFVNARELLNARTIGVLQHVIVQWHFESYDNAQRKAGWKTETESGGGALAYYGSHVLYYLEWLCGPIRKVEIICSAPQDYQRPAETLVACQVVFESGAIGQVSLCCAAFGEQRHQINLHGADGLLTLQTFSGNPVAFSLSLTRRDQTAPVMIIPANDEACLQEDPRIAAAAKIAARFVDAIRTGSAVTPSFSDALRVQRMISSAHQLGW